MLSSSARSLQVLVVMISTLLLAALACAGLPDTAQEIELPQVATPLTPPLLDLIPDEQGVDMAYCDSAEIHPIGESIAVTFEIAYEDVMSLYCDGHEFEEVLLALETQVQSGVAAQTILRMRDDGLSWDTIWQELNLTQ